jgi:transcriptional regulator with XRE-family HTH domain
MIISPVQFKTARQLLKWTQEDLASRSRVSPTAIAILERGVARPLAAKVSAIQTALEDAGVEFTTDEPGVRLRDPIAARGSSDVAPSTIKSI